jgi:hypothetical protein
LPAQKASTRLRLCTAAHQSAKSKERIHSKPCNAICRRRQKTHVTNHSNHMQTAPGHTHDVSFTPPAGGASTADAVNRGLTGALMLVFGGILAFGTGHADASLLAATVDWRAAPPAIPIIFLSLVRVGCCDTSLPPLVALLLIALERCGCRATTMPPPIALADIISHAALLVLRESAVRPHPHGSRSQTPTPCTAALPRTG